MTEPQGRVVIDLTDYGGTVDIIKRGFCPRCRIRLFNDGSCENCGQSYEVADDGSSVFVGWQE